MLEIAVPPRMRGAPPSNARDPRGALVVAILGSSMAFLDGTVVNVALPVMQRQLGISVDLAQWVVEAYSLFLASLVLVGGALGDRLGRRRVFSAGVVIFAIASMACGLAHGALPCIIARAVQGVGAALLVPGSLSLISAAYGEYGRGAAIGAWSAFSAITGAIGPLAGGWVVAHASWRWLFFFNAPVAAVVLALTRRHVAESKDETADPALDWVQVQGYSPAAAGASLLPIVLLVSLMSRSAGGLTAQWGARPLLIVGPLVAASGFVLLAIPTTGGSYWTTFFPGMVALGLGMGVTVAPLTTAVMGSVEAQHAGVASGVNNAVARTAGLLAVAALGLVVVAGFDRVLDGELATMSLPDSVAKIVAAERAKLVAADFSDIGDASLRTALGVAFARGYVAGFRASMLVCAGLAALGAACAFWVVESTSRSGPHFRLGSAE